MSVSRHRHQRRKQKAPISITRVRHRRLCRSAESDARTADIAGRWRPAAVTIRSRSSGKRATSLPSTSARCHSDRGLRWSTDPPFRHLPTADQSDWRCGPYRRLGRLGPRSSVTEGGSAAAAGAWLRRLGISRRDQDSSSGPGAAALPALPGYPLQVSTLAVVGTGPKGIAIAAKARALAAAGLPAPRVVLVDRGEVAGNWSGRQ
jgi:hypothetical protein